MEKLMSISEIEDEFEDEWVLIEDPEFRNDLELSHGKVLFHAPNREDIYRKAKELKPDESAIMYMGDVPDDIAVVI